MTLQIAFDNSYARLPARLFAAQAPTPVRAPGLIVFNAGLAQALGIEAATDDAPALAQILAGNSLPQGATPLAQVYAGHQFGGFSPQLGDGRAILLGEVVDAGGQRHDITLKGAGRTPYSRGGDGRAWLGPVLREYLLSEAMHALGIPTTRALAAVTTGEVVLRDTPLPGAVLTRVAQSHIRVGTFEFLAARRDTEALRALFDHTCARHFPQADGPAGLLQQVVARQADLVAHWLAIGFIHGVMNTDNTALSGETIDYGPAAFLDRWHPQTVYSFIDRHGRYAYDNQANVIVWNMAQLASAMLPLMPDPDAAVQAFTAIVHAMPARIAAARLARFRAKLGLTAAPQDAAAEAADTALIDELLALMQRHGLDFTNTFRALSGDDAAAALPDTPEAAQWLDRWRARIAPEDDPQALMRRSNPFVIARNHQVEAMIAAAVAGDFAPFHRMLRVLSQPFTDQPEALDLCQPPRPEEVVENTFCGT